MPNNSNKPPKPSNNRNTPVKAVLLNGKADVAAQFKASLQSDVKMSDGDKRSSATSKAIFKPGADIKAPNKPINATAATSNDTNQKATDIKQLTTTPLQSYHYFFSDDACYDAKGNWNTQRRSSNIEFIKSNDDKSFASTTEEILKEEWRSVRFFTPASANHTPAYVKTSYQNLTDEDIADWQREEKNYNLAHPGQAKLFFNQQQRSCRLVMTSLGNIHVGQAVEQAIANSSWVEVLTIYLAALTEIKRLHALGIVHGDLKFTNLLFVNGKVVAIDFESSHRLGEKFKATRQKYAERLYEETFYKFQNLPESLLMPESDLHAATSNYLKTAEAAAIIEKQMEKYTKDEQCHLAPELLSKYELIAEPSTDVYAFCKMAIDLTPDIAELVKTGLDIVPTKRPTIDNLIDEFTMQLDHERQLLSSTTPTLQPN